MNFTKQVLCYQNYLSNIKIPGLNAKFFKLGLTFLNLDLFRKVYLSSEQKPLRKFFF